jgi:hypothetical protein
LKVGFYIIFPYDLSKCSTLDLDREKPTKTKIKAVIVKVMRWKGLAEILQTTGVERKIEEMEAELERLMVGLGADVKPAASTKSSKCLTIFLFSLLF